MCSCEPPRVGSQHPWRVPRGIYRCAGDDEWIALSVGTDEEWERLVALVSPEVEADWSAWQTFVARQRNRSAVEAAVGNCARLASPLRP